MRSPIWDWPNVWIGLLLGLALFACWEYLTRRERFVPWKMLRYLVPTAMLAFQGLIFFADNFGLQWRYPWTATPLLVLSTAAGFVNYPAARVFGFVVDSLTLLPDWARIARFRRFLARMVRDRASSGMESFGERSGIPSSF